MSRLTYEEKLAALQPLTLMDDFYMRAFFRDNIPCVEFVLRTILGKKDLVVISVKVQYVLRGPDNSRYVRLDVYAVDSENKHYDIEIQNDPSGASQYRARYNSAAIDINILKTGEPYSLLKERESIVIFITANDVLGYGEPIYFIDRVIMPTGKPFNDGSHIVYVDSSKQDTDTDLGKLMHDFRCSRVEDMLCPVLAQSAVEVKGTQKGDEKMGVLDEMELEAEARGEAIGEARGKVIGEVIARESIAYNLIHAGKIALAEIAEMCGITLKRAEEIAARI